jgi:glycogen operon protein
VEFTRKLIALRHQYPILRRVRWLTGQYDEELEVSDVTWIAANGEPKTDEQWSDPNLRCFGMLLDGRAPETGIRRRGELATLLIVFNSWQDVVRFKLPQAPDGSRFEIGHEYEVTGRSMLVFRLA